MSKTYRQTPTEDRQARRAMRREVEPVDYGQYELRAVATKQPILFSQTSRALPLVEGKVA